MVNISLFILHISNLIDENKDIIFAIKDEKIIFSDTLWYNIIFYDFFISVMNIDYIYKEQFYTLSEEQQQSIYLEFISNSNGIILTVPNLEYDILGSTFYLAKIRNHNNVNYISIFQENFEGKLKLINTQPNLNDDELTLDKFFFFGKELNINLKPISDVNMRNIIHINNRYEHHLIDMNFYNMILGNEQQIKEDNRDNINSIQQDNIINDEIFNTYIDLLHEKVIPLSIPSFDVEFTVQDYGNSNNINNISSNCLPGKLQLRLIPYNTLLYTLSTKPLIKDELNKSDLWAFWDVNDLTYHRINHYNHEYNFEYINVLRTTSDIKLLDLSDPNTILRLRCDTRSTKQFKKYLDYTFEAAIIQNINNMNESKIVHRTSHQGMDDNFISSLQKLYPELNGFIYMRNENTTGHHNEIYMYSGSNIDSEFHISLSEWKLLSIFDFYDMQPTSSMDNSLIDALYYNEMMSNSNYGLIIAILTNIYYKEKKSISHEFLRNISIQYILLRIIYSYMISPLQSGYEKKLSASRIDNEQSHREDLILNHELDKNDNSKNILYADLQLGDDLSIKHENYSNITHKQVFNILSKIFTDKPKFKII